MKTKCKAFALLLVLLICYSVTISASAVSKAADIYGTLQGSSYQKPNDANSLYTSTSVSVNPDGAYLKTDVDFKNGVNWIDSSSKRSASGATSLTYDFTIYFSISQTPTMAYVAHCVQGGADSEVGYACYSKASINIG